MALTLNVNDLLTVRLHFSTANTPNMFNVLHYRVAAVNGPSPGFGASLQLIAQAVFNHFINVWKPIASDQAAFNWVEVNNVFPLPRSNAFRYTPTGPQTGNLDDEPLPQQDSITVLKLTDVGMRWGKGRMYIAGLGEGTNKDGVINPDVLAAFEQFAGQPGAPVTFSGGGFSGSMNPVLVGGPEDNPVRITPVTGSRLSDNRFKRMDRRRVGKGI